MWRTGSKQKVIAQVLRIAQGTVSKVRKKNRETGVPNPRARPGRTRKTTEREDRYLLRLCRNGRTKSANTLRDESRFLLYRIDGRIRVRRQQHEAYNEDCIVPRVQA